MNEDQVLPLPVLEQQLLSLFTGKPLGVGHLIRFLRTLGYTRRQIRQAIWAATEVGAIKLDPELKFVKVRDAGNDQEDE